MKQSFLRKIMTGVLAGVLSAILVWVVSDMLFKNFFFTIEAQTYDWRMRRAIDQPKSPIDDIVIVDIDERSVEKLGSYHQWPRTHWETMVNYLKKAGVAMIGMDFIFDPDRRNPAEDRAFISAIRNAGNVCSALYFSVSDSEHFRPVMTSEPQGLDFKRFLYDVPPALSARLISQERLGPDSPEFLNASYTAGYVNLFPDPDGVLRRIPAFLKFNDHVYSSFAFQMAMKNLGIQKIGYDESHSDLILNSADGKQYSVPIDEHGQMLIHYEGGFRAFRYISFYDVLMGFVQPEYLKDKIIVVGSSLPGLFDLRTTPLQAAYPGVEVNANVIYQILQNKYIHKMSDVTNFIFILIIAVLAGIVLVFVRPLGSILLTVLFMFLIILAGLYSLELYSYWMPMIQPMFAVVVVFASTYVYRYMFEEKDKRRVRRIFSHYVSSSVVDVLLRNPEKVKLGGEKKFCSVLFSDVAGFTTISEQLEPEKLVTLLNEYLTEMTNLIFENQGMLDKYEGDAIMAVFGAPVEMPDHAELACRSALQMQKRLQQLRERWKAADKPELHMRIGVNSGDMVVGNMGSVTRFDYTVMGDSVNLASRLEGANKLYGTEIMIGEKTYELVKDKFLVRPLDMLAVKGKKKPVKAYELIAAKEEAVDTALLEMLRQYEQGFENYLKRNWEWANNYFRQAVQMKSDDGPSRLYLLRCQEFMAHPPAEDWDGIFVMKTK
ncbi:MAG: adenylate/guanylate cyclase domain-containing protein [Calditrichia bacterium]